MRSDLKHDTMIEAGTIRVKWFDKGFQVHYWVERYYSPTEHCYYFTLSERVDHPQFGKFYSDEIISRDYWEIRDRKFETVAFWNR